MKRKKLMKICAAVLLFAALFALTGFGYENKRIFDRADLFSDSEEQQLQEECMDAARQGQLDIAVLTVNSTGGLSAMEYADDFYDESEFGYEDDTGILLLVNMGERQIWISTAGKAIDYFTDSRIDAMVDAITAEMSDGDYVEGVEVFLQESAYFMYQELSVDEWDTQYGGYAYDGSGYENDVKSKSGVLHRVLVGLAAAFAVAGLTVFVMYKQEKGRVSANSHTYLKDNRYELLNRQDIYTHTTTISRKISRTPPPGSRMGGMSGSHGGGFHTSGSGAHHGGGGGRF